jgi:hypothetical protein
MHPSHVHKSATHTCTHSNVVYVRVPGMYKRVRKHTVLRAKIRAHLCKSTAIAKTVYMEITIVEGDGDYQKLLLLALIVVIFRLRLRSAQPV